MSSIKVSSGIPIPAKLRVSGRKSTKPYRKTNSPNAKYPFATMSTGESFFVKNAEERHNAISAAYDFTKRNNSNLQFASMSVSKGYRIWRVA